MIRKAELKDIDSIKNLAKEFYEEGLKEYGLSLDLETLDETIKKFITDHIALVAQRNGEIVGAIGGMLTPSIFNKNQLIGQEVIWYLSKNQRKGLIGNNLINAFEDDCKRKGADFVAMMNIGNLYTAILDRFYKIKGYRLLENQYIKGV